MNRVELLAPAGDMEKLKTAFYFGADAVYIGGKEFSLRALAGNFDNQQMIEAVEFAHSINKKIYVTVNIFARNSDLVKAQDYFKFLQELKVDGVIISDIGLIETAKKVAKNLPINLSTQANTLNYKAVEFFRDQGIKRVILARELSLKEISEIHKKVPDIELETFIHGAMCISYSGRCLLSDYKTGRSSNRGACVQACRWNYEIREKGSNGAYMEIEEDDRGTYILNSKDLNLIEHIPQLIDAGVISFKIEGRMKSEYYLATVINAYRRAIDEYYRVGKDYINNPLFLDELEKTAHREFTTAYLLGENDRTENFNDSQSKGSYKFIAIVKEGNQNRDYALVEMRNRFKVGDTLQVLSPTESCNSEIVVSKLSDLNDKEIVDAKAVQQIIKLYTSVPLSQGDMLRMQN